MKTFVSEMKLCCLSLANRKFFAGKVFFFYCFVFQVNGSSRILMTNTCSLAHYKSLVAMLRIEILNQLIWWLFLFVCTENVVNFEQKQITNFY